MKDSGGSLDAGPSDMNDAQRKMRAPSGLLARIGGWAAVVSLALGAVFAVLIFSVIGLRNHGITATGDTLAEILDRIESSILRQVPMT